MACKRCTRCCYYARGTETCDYYLITKVRRGCPADSKCDKYEPGQNAVRRPRTGKRAIDVVKGH